VYVCCCCSAYWILSSHWFNLHFQLTFAAAAAAAIHVYPRVAGATHAYPRAAAAAAKAVIHAYPRESAAAASAAAALKFHPKTRYKQQQNETHYKNITY
jgi:hypothetical protein